jgi:hypothetical protein
MTWQHILEIYCAVWILIIAGVLASPGIRASAARRRRRNRIIRVAERDYSAARQKALQQLGDKYLLANPLNRRRVK